MRSTDAPRIVTFIAAPPAGTEAPCANPFLDGVARTLSGIAGHQIIDVSSVRDIDLALSKLLAAEPADAKAALRVQIIGHSLSGMLALGAIWLVEHDTHIIKALKFPYYLLDTNPAALGLLSKHAGKLAELMLVGCHIGSAQTYGYAISGRVLTYTLAELLHCKVLGADDVVAPTAFDAAGWYRPGSFTDSPARRGPKGWQWVEDGPPVWLDGDKPRNAAPARGAKLRAAIRSFDDLA